MTGPLRIEETDPGVVLLTLDRPETLNALDRDLIAALHAACDDLAVQGLVRVVVLSGAGRGFCSGLDLRAGDELPGGAEAGAVEGLAEQQQISSLVRKIRALPAPVVAAVNGPAAGGGLGLALAADVRVAAPSATFTASFSRLGLSGCDIGVSWLLPRLIGAAAAAEMMLTGRQVSAAEAERRGLVSLVVDDALTAAAEVADQIRANSPFGMRMTKQVMWAQLEVASLNAGIDLEDRTQVLASMTRDMGEAVRAFREGRPPTFTGQ